MYNLNKVSFHYRAAQDGRLEGLSVDELEIAKTGITAVIGPSGSGKTTLLSMLAGFVCPEVAETGSFSFGQKDLRQQELEPGDVAFVFQSSLLLGAGTAGLNTLQGHVASGKAELDVTRYQRLSQHLGLDPEDGALFARKARRLSGGQAQRMAVLRALATDAKAILCDEPTSSLDRANARQVLVALKEWSKDRPVVWVTHGLNEAAEYADNFVFLRSGQVHQPTPSQAAHLASDDVSRRLSALEALSKDYFVTSQDGVSGADDNSKTVRISGQDFRTWIAHALSMDSRVAEWGASDGVGSVQTLGENKALAQLVPGMAQVGEGFSSRLGRFLRFLVGYTQQATMVLLAIMAFQVFVSLSVYFVANAFITDRLQDPAVARLSFERVISSDLDARAMGAVLDFAQLDQVADHLKDSLGPDASKEDRDRTRVTGIRHERHLFRGRVDGTPSPNDMCPFSSIQATVTAPDDPLLNQTKPLDGLTGGNFAEMISTAYANERYARVAVITRGARDRLASTECALPDGPISLDWNGAQAPPYYDLTRVFVVEALPPSYPYFPEVLLFENDYQNFVRIVGAKAGPFETANAYFPLNSFATMRAEVDGMGYTVKEDTEAAVKLLQQVERIFQIGPGLLLMFSAIVGATVLARTLSTLLELNKRVLTLFRAYGFRLRDILSVVFLHFRPALVGVVIVVFVAGEATWYMLEGFLSNSDLGNLTKRRYTAHIVTAAGFLSVSGAVICLLVLNWWSAVGRRLSDNLKE
ncbi:ATP-binding cassette domain-containing protein [Thalassococcus sp. BH17M4-6]|uniref:ATP-binding cassette domain-containing protein n=1 Tax=Thalassococcus sp. BH17M4-6 TaxID=3413148 RepID=UPI003BDEEA93